MMISYLKLENDKEIFVMKSVGLSPLRLSIPLFCVIYFFNFIYNSHFILPKTYKN